MTVKKRGIQLRAYGWPEPQVMTPGDEVSPLQHDEPEPPEELSQASSTRQLARAIRMELEETLDLLDDLISSARSGQPGPEP